MIIAPVVAVAPPVQPDARASLTAHEIRNSPPEVPATPPVQTSTANLPLLQHHEHEVKRILDGKRVVYRFVDKETGEVVYQIPSEEVLNIMQGIQEQLQRQATCTGIDENL
jgi:hypothetical protein